MWPFGKKKLETRADGYTEALIAQLTDNSNKPDKALPATIGALEACAGLVGRAFAACPKSPGQISPRHT